MDHQAIAFSVSAQFTVRTMTKHSRHPLDGLESISKRNEWKKELTALPTYAAAALLAWRYAGANDLGIILILIAFIMIYHQIYGYIFPKFETSGRTVDLITLFFGQLAFWVMVFWLLFFKK